MRKKLKWNKVPQTDYDKKNNIVWWEALCDFCKNPQVVPNDQPDRCPYCGRDGDGNLTWAIAHRGDYGYFGDGDWTPTGHWQGRKLIRPCYVGGRGYHPKIWLSVDAYGTRTAKTRTYRPRHWYAHLELDWAGLREAMFEKPRRATTIKQVKKEADELDTSEAIGRLLRKFYSKSSAQCVWRKEGDKYVEWYSTFMPPDGLAEWSTGKYLVAKQHHNGISYESYERAQFGLAGSSCKIDGGLPHPWTVTT